MATGSVDQQPCPKCGQDKLDVTFDTKGSKWDSECMNCRHESSGTATDLTAAIYAATGEANDR